MKKIYVLIYAVFVYVAVMAQTMNVQTGNVIYQIPANQAGIMTYSKGESITIVGRVFPIDEITKIYVDDAEVTDDAVVVNYGDNTATVFVAGNIARFLTVQVAGAHVLISQADSLAQEITYTLQGNSEDGEFYLAGTYKATIELAGLALTNPTGAPINIQNGKRIDVSIKKDTENTLIDGEGHSLKGCFICKGHTEFKGKGTLNVYGRSANAIWSKEYVQMKNCTINVVQAIKDGINCNQYFLMESGSLTVKGVGDDALQVSYEDDGTDEEDTGDFTLLDGVIDLIVTGGGAKGVKTDHDVLMQGGAITVTQTGNLVADTELSYPTSIKAGGDIHISGGTVTINNTAAGGKGLSAEGDVLIDESNTSTAINITANGSGGAAEINVETPETPQASYKVYVSLPTSGGGGGGGGGNRSAWTSLYLYNSDDTMVQQLTKTVSRTSSNGYTTLTFYYYDFGENAEGTYYFKSDNYNSRGTTYTIKSSTFSPPTSGTDIYYSISNNYTTSGSTRTYSLSNVTNTYGGSTDASEDNGVSYNAIGVKADGNLIIDGGTIVVANNGAMSKSMKAGTSVNINGGNITLTPSGNMMTISNDASYSSGIKTKTFVINDGTLTINASGTAGRGVSANYITTNGGVINIKNTGSGQQGTNDSYSAKGMKADNNVSLLAGDITITMSGSAGKGIKSAGTYIQGTENGQGPTLKITTSGAMIGSSGGGWGQSSSNKSSAKGIKVQGAATIYSGDTEVNTSTNGAEGLESKTAVYIEGGQHYFKCYDDCINSSGKIYFNGGITVCYSNGNDAVDSNAGQSGAITIGNGTIFAFTTKGDPEEGLDCDNNSYIQITGTGIGISAGGVQGGGSSSSTISNAKQGYAFVTSTISYTANRYYSLVDASDNNLVTYSFPASLSSRLALFTATGMVKGSSYKVKYSTAPPTDATTVFHGLYLGSSATGTTQTTTFTAK